MELYAAFERAAASTEEDRQGRAPGDLTAPTPCSEWDVRALLNHVIGTLWLSTALFTGQQPRYPMAPGGLPGTDLAGDDPAAAYAGAAAAALAAAGTGDTLTRMHTTPLGEMPGPVLSGFTTLDVLVHGWDLARATGQPAAWTPRSRSTSWTSPARPSRRNPGGPDRPGTAGARSAPVTDGSPPWPAAVMP